MSNAPNPFGFQPARPLDYAGPGTDTIAVSKFFNAVYAWMAAGLAVTAVVAYAVATHGNLAVLFRGPALIVIIIAELALVWVVAGAVNRISAGTATVLFLIYAALNGVLLSSIFLIYAQSSIFSAFLTTAVMFGVMSVYGFVTKTDLTSIGRLAIMAVIGLIVALVVNLFVHNTMVGYAISYLGVLIFVALTAYDTQKLKIIAEQTQSNAALAARLSIVGALTLYLDFINLFLLLLRIMGDRR